MPTTSSPRRRRIHAALAAAAIVTCTGCGAPASEPTARSGPTEALDDGAYPMTLTHHLGEITLEEPPERIVALGLSDMDTLVGLDVVPVGASAFPLTGTVPPWLDGMVDVYSITFLDTTEAVPVEQVATLRPDLILATDYWHTAEFYDDLSAIAPVLAAPDERHLTVLLDSIDLIGRALDRPGDAARLRERFGATIGDVAASHPGLDGLSYAYGLVRTTTEVAIVTDPGNVTTDVFEGLGLSVADPLAELEPDAWGFTVFSPEEIEHLGSADLLLLGYLSDELQDSIETNDVFGRLRAVENGTYLRLGLDVAAALQTPTPLNLPWALDRIEPALAAAAAPE